MQVRSTALSSPSRCCCCAAADPFVSSAAAQRVVSMAIEDWLSDVRVMRSNGWERDSGERGVNVTMRVAEETAGSNDGRSG